MFVAVAAVLVAGCQSNPEPPPFESGSDASPTATEPPSDAAPTLPPEAKGTSEASAKAFVRHYIDTVNHAMRTGDTDGIDRASAGTCASCSAVAANIGDLYGTGGYLEGRGWRITAIDALPRASESEVIVQVGVFVSPQKRFKSRTAEPEKFEGGQQSMTFFLRRATGAWAVTRWNQTS